MLQPTGVPMPDKAAPRMPPIRHVPWRCEVKVWLLNRTYHRWMMHHDPEIPPRGADVPCLLDKGCPYCQQGEKLQPARLTGWIAALGRSGPRELIGKIVLAMPFLLCQDVEALIEPHQGLRGLELTLSRGDKRFNDSVRILDVVSLGDPPLGEYDVQGTLENAWKRPGFHAGIARRQREQEASACKGHLERRTAMGGA